MQPTRGRSVYPGDMRSTAIAILLTACGPRSSELAAPRPTSAAAAPARALPAYASAEPITSPRLFAAGAVSTADPEFATTFAADGATVYFDRANADRSKLIILSSTYAGGAWQPAAPLPFSTGEFRDVDPFVVGDRLYFSSNRPG